MAGKPVYNKNGKSIESISVEICKWDNDSFMYEGQEWLTQNSGRETM